MLIAEKRPEKQRVKTRTGKGLRSIRETMLAEAIDRFGPPQVLRPHTLPVPKLGSTEILGELHAAGVGIWDAKLRDGTSRIRQRSTGAASTATRTIRPSSKNKASCRGRPSTRRGADRDLGLPDVVARGSKVHSPCPMS
jgi:hypothetical protein